ncbi:MAG: permease-like cell division protein FtsX [Candidatus Pacebacteria bacterium]|nr:permease-like cell division protein FtsX [Candidatus Paceibacterota bacterium]
MITTTFRITRYGFKNFLRNGWLSVATVAVMLLALFFFLGLMLFRFVTISALDSVKDKIDISVYFKIEAAEDEMLRIKAILEDLSEIKSIEYVSRDKALSNFKEKHQGDAAEQALKELDENPFLASLNIKANDPSQYSAISSYIENGSFDGVIEKVTFAQNQLVIERLSTIISNVNRAGLSLTIILAIIAILVAFNTIWLAMYSNREEIGIMRLVGASNTYIRGPYIVEGVIYGVIAAVLSILISIPVILTVSPWMAKIASEIDLKGYFFSNIFSFFLYQIVFGILLGAISSFIAIRRYLRV